MTSVAPERHLRVVVVLVVMDRDRRRVGRRRRRVYPGRMSWLLRRIVRMRLR